MEKNPKSQISNPVRPFTTLSGGYHKYSLATTPKSDAELGAQEQMLEQIAELIDYDVSDYLPPSSHSQLLSTSDKGSRTKN